MKNEASRIGDVEDLKLPCDFFYYMGSPEVLTTAFAGNG